VETIKREYEHPKEILEIGECIANILVKIGEELNNGWQPANDIPAIISASFTELVKAIDGVNKLPEEFGYSPIKGSLALINPIALGIEKMLESRKR
jgi:hypothetical protein